jgi:hypothetical protein
MATSGLNQYVHRYGMKATMRTAILGDVWQWIIEKILQRTKHLIGCIVKLLILHRSYKSVTLDQSNYYYLLLRYHGITRWSAPWEHAYGYQQSLQACHIDYISCLKWKINIIQY